MKKLLTVIAVTVLVLSLFSVACSGKKTSSTPTTNPPTSQEPTTTPPPPTTTSGPEPTPSHASYTSGDLCAACHDGSTAGAVPESHKDFTTDLCVLCHDVTNIEALPNDVVPDHSDFDVSLAGKCHTGAVAGALPDNHKAYSNDMCTMCHDLTDITNI